MSQTTCCGRAKSRPAWVAALIVVLAVAGAWLWQVRWRTYHFAEVRAGVLYRDGNRGMGEFATAIRKGGIRTIVMLNDDAEVGKEPFQGELEFCRERGIKLVRIPVKLGGRPTSQDVRRFLEVLEEKRNWPVLVHCAQGVRRTGMMVAAYQLTVMGWDKQRAKAEVTLWGRKAQRLDDVRGFVEDYDAVGRTVGTSHRVTLPQDAD
ncbi:MAG: tyrosine-protein phosphatase [Planctomycetota bacterium]|nr:tyrosine-protein phosphatase [Planctomycetota bacterium]